MISAQVSIVRLNSYDPAKVDQALATLLEPFGGMKTFVQKTSYPIIKPNFLAPKPADKATCTHPEIIRGVARILKDSGAQRPVLTDSPGVGTAEMCASKLGLSNDDTLMEILNADDQTEYALPDNSYNKLILSKRMIEGGPLINLAKAKTHGHMVITAAAKNTFGAMVGMQKAQFHFRCGKDAGKFARLLVSIHDLVAPVLNIVDAVVAMEGNGPGSGTPRKLGILLAGTNAHAVDYALAQIWGLEPEQVYTLDQAKQMGLLPTPNNISYPLVHPSEIILDSPWKQARPALPKRMIGPNWMVPLFDKIMALKPIVDSRCNGCQKCVAHCAAKAIELDEKDPVGRIKFNYKSCISCFCCQEVCPTGAIEAKSGLLASMLGLGNTTKKQTDKD